MFDIIIGDMRERYDVIIIGAGIAGMTAAIYAVRAGKKVLILESRAEGGQILTSNKIENWPGEPGISGAELARKVKEQAKALGAEFKVATAEEIEKAGADWRVVAEDETLETRAIILAMGTKPRKMSVKQTADAGKRAISYCATCDGALYKGKPVVVVGSGNTAKHEMAYLQGVASKVYHIHHDDPIPEDAVAVFVAIGRVPSTEIGRGVVKLDEEGYVVAGEDCRTSTPGIWVAGDCRTKNLRQLITAAADGAIAGAEVAMYIGGGRWA